MLSLFCPVFSSSSVILFFIALFRFSLRFLLLFFLPYPSCFSSPFSPLPLLLFLLPPLPFPFTLTRRFLRGRAKMLRKAVFRIKDHHINKWILQCSRFSPGRSVRPFVGQTARDLEQDTKSVGQSMRKQKDHPMRDKSKISQLLQIEGEEEEKKDEEE